MTSTTLLDELARLGYTIVPRVFSTAEADLLAHRLSSALELDSPSVLRSRGQTYGSRDLIGLFPEVCDVPRRQSLKAFVTAALGPRAGVVRALYFDKPPDRAWSLPWHKDRMIAVKRNDLPSDRFRRQTVKAGIPHVEASESLLAGMLTLRLHLDAMTAENGPLSVIAGSHLMEVNQGTPAEELHAEAGDVLAMRP